MLQDLEQGVEGPPRGVSMLPPADFIRNVTKLVEQFEKGRLSASGSPSSSPPPESFTLTDEDANRLGHTGFSSAPTFTRTSLTIQDDGALIVLEEALPGSEHGPAWAVLTLLLQETAPHSARSGEAVACWRRRFVHVQDSAGEDRHESRKTPGAGRRGAEHDCHREDLDCAKPSLGCGPITYDTEKTTTVEDLDDESCRQGRACPGAPPPLASADKSAPAPQVPPRTEASSSKKTWQATRSEWLPAGEPGDLSGGGGGVASVEWGGGRKASDGPRGRGDQTADGADERGAGGGAGADNREGQRRAVGAERSEKEAATEEEMKREQLMRKREQVRLQRFGFRAARV